LKLAIIFLIWGVIVTCHIGCGGEEDIPGCTNSLADNFSPEATMDDGSCRVTGCTDPEAENYDENANVSSNDCIYARDKFIGKYSGSLSCNLLMELNTDSAEIEIQIVPNNVNEVSIVITSIDTELPLNATVDGDELSLVAEDFPFQVVVLGNLLDILINAEGTVSTDDGGQTLSGMFTATGISAETGTTIASDECTIIGTKIE